MAQPLHSTKHENLTNSSNSESNINTFKKGLLAGAAALAMSMSAQASEINVGGVVWDPESMIDFTSHGSITESFAGVEGDIVSGHGMFSTINSGLPNFATFCPGCELTFTLSMELKTIVSLTEFAFKDLTIDIYVDDSLDYQTALGTFTESAAEASNGDLWLSLFGSSLVSTGTNLGTASATGTGSSLLDVMGGLAMSNFDTDSKLGGADFVLASTFLPSLSHPGFLAGTFILAGDSIPEPSTIALLGLGLLGFAGARKRKA